MASPGRKRVTLASADAIAEEMIGAIVTTSAPRAAAPAVRQWLRRHAADGAVSHVPRRAARARRKRHQVTRSLVGYYVTSLDMAGASVTLTLLDEEMLQHWDAPVHTAALRWGC